ncbi:Glycosylphosphatidylinositol:protein transamidase complex, GAA1 component [Beauveria brongniartii RCEF 3172]|uniref:Glycosylphosphatidylinositol:protein transamidase complex, GAA1 component n=1 Tax=Beauveria brongniartii RCEF 3172 TaxID=1081107 RepID=A0A166WCW5_9HYPO|nr:Glycosylphosphatidylinositol:protein transamidase complex, GAA1 component [Beauveria brongniartii RCEF 3172]
MALRRDPRMLKLPPYLSLVCIAVGFAWLLLLPLENYSRRTYISENALLPGQVHTYFGGSEQNVFRAYRRELDLLESKTNHQINDQIESFLKEVGVKVGRQNYTYHNAGNEHSGENIYGILQAPRGDATEAIVLVAAWKTVNEEMNRNGVTLALTLARYFKRWSLWSKDIIIVIPPDSKAGTQAWVDAYHDAHDSRNVAPLPLKSGALQGALALDYALDHRFEALHIIYDGTNGQLPNLDLINSMVNIAGGQMGVHTAIQGMESHSNTYQDRLHTILQSMMRQSLGLATGPHSSFIPYHVDAITLQPYGEGWHDEMALGRIVEGTFRSLNNLLEHLHQSFFFYLLMHRDHFVSIGTYLPSAMLLAANFSIMAIFLWVKSGQAPQTQTQASGNRRVPVVKNFIEAESSTVERDLFLPLSVVITCQTLSVIPLFTFNNISSSILSPAFAMFTLTSVLLPWLISHLLSLSKANVQQYQLIKSFSLLFLGMSLATLATLNFSLAFLVGMLATPFTFVRTSSTFAVRLMLAGLLTAIAPPVMVYSSSQVLNIPVPDILMEASFGWNVWGMYTPIVVWCVWWPSWVLGMVNVVGSPVV